MTTKTDMLVVALIVLLLAGGFAINAYYRWSTELAFLETSCGGDTYQHRITSEDDGIFFSVRRIAKQGHGEILKYPATRDPFSTWAEKKNYAKIEVDETGCQVAYSYNGRIRSVHTDNVLSFKR